MFSLQRFATAAAAALVLSLSACAGLTDPEEEYAAATRAVERWVAARPSGWSLNLTTNRALSRPEWSRSCADDPPGGFVVLRHAAPGTEIDLHFRCPVGGRMGAAELSAAFSHAVLQHLPHGIHSRGWSFRVSTPTSSVEERVAFTAPGSGRIELRVETPLYAVYGHSDRPSCQPPADAPSPEGCWLLREYRVPLHLKLNFPFTGFELD